MSPQAAPRTRIQRCGNAMLLGAILAFLLPTELAFADFEFSAGFTPWSYGTASPGGETPTDVATADLDLDGDLDVVLALTGSSDPDSVVSMSWFENVNGVLNRTPAWSSEDAFRGFSVIAGDIDGNGWPDLVFGGEDSIRVYLNHSGVIESQSSQRLPGSFRKLILVDLDGDRRLDLFVSGKSGWPPVVHRNDNGVFDEVGEGLPTAKHFPHVGDFDGDGDIDLDFEGERLLNEAGDFSTIVTVPAGVPVDFDHDGDLDIVTGAGVYFDQTGLGTFGTTPDLEITGLNATPDAAVDFDGDGDFDFIVGDEVLELDESTARRISESSLRSFDPPRFADIDGDGRVDYFSPRYGFNTTVVLQTTLAMFSTATPDTLSLVGQGLSIDVFADGTSEVLDRITNITPGHFGDPTNEPVPRGFPMDMDLDGDLDVVDFWPETMSMHAQNSGAFGPEPTWTIDVDYSLDPLGLLLQRFDIGDIDGDGLPDILVAPEGPSQVFAYFATDGIGPPREAVDLGLDFEDAINSSWLQDIRLVDIDVDGDLDLLVRSGPGNDSPPRLMIFRNVNGIIESSFSWHADLEPSSEVGGSLDLGDLDGDGGLDLVVSTNELDFLQVFWSNREGLRDSSSNLRCSVEGQDVIVYGAPMLVELSDFDDDSDLDIALYGQMTGHGPLGIAWENNDGSFDVDPVWTLPSKDAIERFPAAQDLDDDGHVEFAFNDLLYRGVVGQLDARTRGLPVAPARVLRVATQNLGDNNLTISFDLVDVENDPARVYVDYRFRGSTTWNPVDLVGTGSSSTLALPSSPTGIRHEVQWDLRNLTYDPREVELRLRTVETTPTLPAPWMIPRYIERVGRILPRSPNLFAAPIVDVPTVTVGDQLERSITLTNRGQEILVLELVSDFHSAIVEARASDTVVAPGEEVTVDLSISITEVPTEIPWVDIASNDPLQPVKRIEIPLDVRSLAFAAGPLATGEAAPLGTAVTFTFRPLNDASIDSAKLIHRPARSTASGDTLSFALTTEGLEDPALRVAVLPSEHVVEGGVEYRVVAYNGVASARVPADDEPEPWRLLPVGPPSGLTIRQVAEESVLPTNSAAEIVVVLPEGTRLESDSSWLHFRSGGSAELDSVRLEGSTPVLVATIADSLLDERGLEVQARVMTLTGMLYAPSESTFDFVTLESDRLVEPVAHTRGQYRLVSLPRHFSGNGKIVDILGSQFGGYDPRVWRAFTFDGTDVVEVTSEDALDAGPGLGFWLNTRSHDRIDVGFPGRSVSSVRDFEVELEPDWNFVGNPWAFEIDLSQWQDLDMRVYRDRQWPALEDVDFVVRPYEAFIVDSGESAQVRVLASRPTTPSRKAEAQNIDTRLQFTLGEPGGLAASVVIGTSRSAEIGRDRLDLRVPPRAPDEWLELAIDHTERETAPGSFQRDVRPPTAEAQLLTLSMAASTDSGPWSLRLDALEGLPEDHVVELVDPRTGVSYDTTELQDGVELLPPSVGRSQPLILIMGAADQVEEALARSVPASRRFELHQNVPNPFNPATQIAYSLPSSERVQLFVYNARGERVARLVDGETVEAGRHAVIWSGTDDNGRAVASGLYFVKLKAGKLAQSRKLMLVR